MLSFRNIVVSSATVRDIWRCAGSNLILARSANIYHYKRKQEREKIRRGESLEWAAPVLKNLQQKTVESGDEAVNNEPPHMLHVVCLIKRTHGRPWWEKQIIQQLQLDGKLYQPVIHKNVPSINRLLDEVKHLVHIQPLRFPHGLPKHESDFEHTMIRSNGEMVVKRRLQQFEPKSMPVSSESEGKMLQEGDKWKLTLDTVKAELERRIQRFDIHSEFFKPNYKYRRNEDGKEYRYTFNKDVPKYDW